VPDEDGDMYLASSDTDPDKPYRRGFSFEELTKMIQKSISDKIVVILDCCYSGSAKISKGHEEDAAKIGRTTIDEKSRFGQGKYILSASQAAQEAYALTTGEHSIFTYYLLQGLRGDAESVDNEGNVTPQSLGRYVYRAIMGLPPDKRPRQTPFTRAEGSGDVILAPHPELARKVVETVPTPSPDQQEKGSRKYELSWRKKYRLLIPVIAAAIVVGSIIIFLPGSFLRPITHSNNATSIIYNAGFNNGTQTALADTQNGKLFNPSCDPTGVHASGGQHPTPFCTGWTSGYISEWKSKHPSWSSGNITSWKPNNPPASGTVLSCTQCGSKLKPIVRFINGTNDGGQAALNTIQNRGQFDPACDPTHAHTTDGLHTTEYCNGWTSGYIYSWNTKQMPTTVHLAALNVGSGTSHPTTPAVNHKKPIPTLALRCKSKSGNNLICTYTNST
jgi:caspase domain-containing protein